MVPLVLPPWSGPAHTAQQVQLQMQRSPPILLARKQVSETKTGYLSAGPKHNFKKETSKTYVSVMPLNKKKKKKKKNVADWNNPLIHSPPELSRACSITAGVRLRAVELNCTACSLVNLSGN